MDRQHHDWNVLRESLPQRLHKGLLFIEREEADLIVVLLQLGDARGGVRTQLFVGHGNAEDRAEGRLVAVAGCVFPIVFILRLVEPLDQIGLCNLGSNALAQVLAYALELKVQVVGAQEARRRRNGRVD